MNILAWIVFGALVGWVAGLIAGHQRMGCLTDIVVGIVGAFIGGALVEFITGGDFIFRFNLISFIVALIGAVILLSVVSLFRRGAA
ncbi:MAG: GlsB/YeaQ/YmgE family stress response membrane protein [Chloroflexi bacterium]|nr:GlsB/YeaQ/YmgE family stress response membrane protein [Chloroflexota bacterium]MCL5025358.1 GlsB/YeaQ/YmgE family stress response membrane protein [Chloroflexota bacterium]